MDLKFVTTIGLPEREEAPERYDLNNELNKRISRLLKSSAALLDISSIDENIDEDVPMIYLSKQNGYLPYGGKTLGESGCAVFCFEQGLRNRGIIIPLRNLADEIASKSYYCFGVGTYHNLFDHYGLRRATDAHEIFDALKMGKISTVLVANKKYRQGIERINSSKEVVGNHFVNIVGKEGNKFIVDDAQVNRITIDIEAMFEAMEIVWIW